MGWPTLPKRLISPSCPSPCHRTGLSLKTIRPVGVRSQLGCGTSVLGLGRRRPPARATRPRRRRERSSLKWRMVTRMVTEVQRTMATETASTNTPSTPATTHTVVHIEVPANDAPKLQAFYSSLFGWTFEAMPAMADYAAANIGEADDMFGFAVYPKPNPGA